MAFFTAFGLAGENALAHNHASPKGARPNPTAATKRTANEKYGLRTISKRRALLYERSSFRRVLAKAENQFFAVHARFLAVYSTFSPIFRASISSGEPEKRSSNANIGPPPGNGQVLHKGTSARSGKWRFRRGFSVVVAVPIMLLHRHSQHGWHRLRAHGLFP